MKKIKQILSNRENWITIITLAVCCIGLFISFFYDEFSNKIISLILIMIAVENFVIQSCFLADIKQKLEHMKFHSNTIQIKLRWECKSFYDVINEAESDVFISGLTLNSLSGIASLLVQTAKEKDLKVYLLVTDVLNEELLEQLSKIRNRELGSKDLSLAQYLSGQEGIFVKKSTTIMPTTFVAHDLDNKDNGYIKAEHLFSNSTSSKNPCIELCPSDSSWDLYKEQINSLWNRNDNVEISEQ